MTVTSATTATAQIVIAANAPVGVNSVLVATGSEQEASSFTVTNATPVPATITWVTPTSITYGTALSDTQLNATANVPGKFVYVPAAGTVLTAGRQTLTSTFTPTDTIDYTVTTATVNLTVNKATPVIACTPSPIQYGMPLQATTLACAANIPGVFTYSPVLGTVLAAGTDSILVTFTPTNATDYNITTATMALTVNKATPTITWATPAAITYGMALSSAQLDATANVPGTFAYNLPAGTMLSAGSQTLSVIFTPTDTIDYITATATVSLTVNQATPVITWVPAPIVYGTPLGAAQLNATATVPGTFVYTPSSGAILPTGTDILATTFTPTDTTDYVFVTQTALLNVVPPYVLPAAGIINTIVGNGTLGYLGDGGAALGAELNNPFGVAVDAAGNVYIADALNNVIRKVTASTGGIATIAGNGTAGYSGDGGAATSAQLYAPTGIALDAAGNIYIADTNNNIIREVNASTGIITTVAGNGIAGYAGDGGVATNAQLNTPIGVAVDASGNVYIADARNNVIRKVTVLNGVIATVAGNSIGGDSGDGALAINAELNYPTSVVVDAAGNLYIADTFNERIRKVTASTGIITAFAGKGAWGYAGDGGTAVNAELSNPTGLAVDAAGNVYIADTGNSVIREVTASTQVITTIAGNGTWGYSGDGGLATSAQLGIDQVDGIAVDALGNIYIADVDNNVIRAVGAVKMTPTVTVSASPSVVFLGAVTSTLMANVSSGTGTVTFSNGLGWSSGAIPVSNGIASVSLNNAGWTIGAFTISASYSGDNLNNIATGKTTLAVNSTSKATPTITWPAPSPITYGTALSAVQLNATASVPGTFVYSPAAGTVPAKGTITLSVMFLPTNGTNYNVAAANVSLTVNSASWSMPGAGIISTMAGNGITGYSGDGGLATNAELTTYQSEIAVDGAGNIYLADWQDNVVRKITAGTWVISTVAGNGAQGYSGDQGPAASAELYGPAGVAVDALGNIYIADTGNNVIREVSFETGIITTVAGNATIGYSGDGGPATQAALYFPNGISVAANGDLYVADTGNSVIRKVTAATGTITTVAGNGTSGYSGDGSSATGATLNAPTGVAIDTSGNLYIADFSNNSIRAVYTSGTILGVPAPVTGNIYTLVGNEAGAAINATLSGPEGVTVDASGNIYIADSNDNLIRAVYSSGTLPGISNPVSGNLYTLAGNGTSGYTGDGGLATNAELNGPVGVAVDAFGNIYIVDAYNQVVRAVGAIGKSSSSITWPAPASIIYGTALSAMQLNATASVLGSMVYTPSAGTTLTAGTQKLAVTFTPTDTTDYAAATSTATIVVNQATPVITWAIPAMIVPGTALSAAQLNATASVPGTFVYSPAAGTVPPTGTVPLTVTFMPTDTVDYTVAASSVALTVQQLTPVITWPIPAPITYGTPLSAAQLNATSSVPGTFAYSQAVGTVLPAGTSTLTVTFTPTDTTGYTTATASVPLVVNQATPTVSWAIPAPITYGTPLSAAQLNATASVPGTFAYSPALGSVPPSGTSTLTAIFTPTDSMDYTAATASVLLAVNPAIAPGTPLLQLRMGQTPNTVTLSNPVNLDWIVWGADGSTTAATRMANANLISDITPLNGASITADSSGFIGYNWTGGTPIATGNAVAAEMTTTGAGAGFQVTAPADTTVKTLLLYVYINANAQLNASISDGSSPAISHSPVTAQDVGYEIYSIDYRALSTGQTLTVQLVSTDSTATVGLQAAVLQSHLPEVAVLSPLSGQTFTATGIPVIVNATQFDASVASVQLILNGTPNVTMTAAPYETTLNPPPGHYVLQAQATDTAGLVNISGPVTFDAIGTGGSLSDSFAQLSSNVDLTSEGTADWTLFVPSTTGGTQIERKDGVVPLISNDSILAMGPYTSSTWIQYYYGNSFSFEDGTPDPWEPGVWPETDLSTTFPNNNLGFQIVVAADTTPRTLRLYVTSDMYTVPGYVYSAANAQMTAFLSDGSALAITDNSFNDTYGWDAQGYYAINYSAASAGQTLTVRLTVQGAGPATPVDLGLVAASLTGAPALEPPVVTSITPSSGTTGNVVTVAGSGFGATQGSSTVTFSGVPATAISWGREQIEAVVPVGVQTGSVQVITAAGASNTDVLFTLAPTVTSLFPSAGPDGTVVTITGVGFGSTQGSGSVSFNGIAATPSSWSDTQIVVSVPTGATTGSVAVTQGIPATGTPLFTVTSGIPGSPLPVLQVRLDDSPKSVNLSDPVNQDWVLWESQTPSGGSTNGSYATIRKAGANLISDLTPLNSTIYSDCSEYSCYQSGGVQYSWTGGTPTATGSDINSPGIIASFDWYIPNDDGLQITAPADTTVRTLKIYSGATGYDQLNVSISDGSSPAVTYIPTATYDFGEKVYTIDYRAASAGQTITAQLTAQSSASWYVYVEAAVLQPHLPQVSIVSPLDGQELPAQSVIPVGVDAMQFDSAISSGSVSANGSQLFTFDSPAYATTWTPQPGHYSLQAQATDADGLSNKSKPVYLDVIGAGGSLMATHNNTQPSAPIDLTSEGTADWIMFVNCNSIAYAPGTGWQFTGPVRKAGVAPLISSYTVLGDVQGISPGQGGGYSSGFAYEEGTPDNQESSVGCGASVENGVPGSGFEIKVNADTVPRTLHLYVGAENAGGKLKAFLSDGSAPVLVDTSLVLNQAEISNNGGSLVSDYAINYSAASPGQTLTVQWITDAVYNAAAGYEGYAELFAAALSGPPAPSAGPSIVSLSPTSGTVGTLVTLTGTGFGASQGSSTVTFNGVAGTPASWSDTQIQVPVPAPDNPGNVVVTVSGVASDPVMFSMPPTITGLSSSSGVVGSSLTISGTNFGLSQGTGSVSLGYACSECGLLYATVVNWSETQIQIVVPDCWEPQLTVATSQGQSNTVNFTCIEPPAPIAPTIQWATPAPIPIGTSLSATQLNATASVPGAFAYTPAAGTVYTALGTYTLSVTFTPTDTTTYTTAIAQVSITVTQIMPAITWTAPAPITYGTALSAAQLNATASVPGTFVYNPAVGAFPVTGTDTLSVTFTPTDTTDYASATATVSLVVNPGSNKGIEIPPPGMIDTIVGNGTAGSSGDGGPSTNAELNSPYGIAVDASGNVYIADTGNNVVREVNAATGVITTIAGNYTAGYSGDGSAAVSAELNNPYGIAVDAAGNLYIADSGNNVIRQVNASTGVINTIVGDGTGKGGYIGDGGLATAAELNIPTGVAVDASGNIYIADWMNNAIREVSVSTGIITTAVGDGTGKAGYLGDNGPATSAKLNEPFGVAVDNTSGNATSGNLYIADSYNNRIRVVNATTQVISTFAGDGIAGYGGDNGLATSAALANPLGVAVDASGNLFIADWLNNAIREVTPNSGVITTVAGMGLSGYSGDGGQGANAKLNGPAAVATDALVALANAQNAGTAQNMLKPRSAIRSMSQIKPYVTPGSPGGGCNGCGGNPYIPDTNNNVVRVVGNPTLNTPPFPVPPGQYLAWALPTGDSTSENVSAPIWGSASFYVPGFVTWTGFSIPASLPANPTIQGIYAVEAYTATSLNDLKANLTVNGDSYDSISSNGIGVGYTQNLGTSSLPSSIGATLTGSGEGSFIITSAALAITYTIAPQPPSPPGSCEQSNCGGGGGDGRLGGLGGDGGGGGSNPPPPQNPTYTLALVDPYTSPIPPNALVINPNDAINASRGGSTAVGIVADGTSTAIAVFGIDVHGGPAPTGDVTFVVDNNATLAPFDPGFLNTAPAPWSTSGPPPSGTTCTLTCVTLVVPAANLIAQGGKYYALALVTAGLPATSQLGSFIEVSVTGNLAPNQALTVYPVPALFVHGLWGDKSSLESTMTYIQKNTYAGTIARPYFFTPVCYSIYLAYYAQDDDLPGNGTGCEQTSTTALASALGQLYKGLDSEHIVGGRVDLIAHSMGGLVARNFSSFRTSGYIYKNTRNHAQGTFRDVVTLDTPEAGSILAWYQDNVFANRPEDPSQYPIIPTCIGSWSYCPTPRYPSLASWTWDITCGSNKQITYRQCTERDMGPGGLFGRHPLAPPQDPSVFTRGSVASLIPGDSHLVNLPDPNIPNATWYAIASDYEAGGASEVSVLETSLDNFYAATWPILPESENVTTSSRYPSIQFMMTDYTQPYDPPVPAVCNQGTEPYGIFHHNDAIVPVCSQIYHAIPGQYYIFPGLVHTAAPWALSRIYSGISAPGVTDYEQVNQLVAYWLGYASRPPFLGRVPTALDRSAFESFKSETDNISEERTLFAADERLTAAMPDNAVELAQPVQIPLNLTDGNVASITVNQHSAKRSFTNQSASVAVGEGEAKVVQDDGLIKTVEVTPLQVGTVDVEVQVLFADGGISHQSYQLNVVPSSKGVRKFYLNQGFPALPIVLEDKDEDRQAWLSPEVYYDQLDYPIYLTDSTQIKFTVEQPGDPIISVDSNGLVHGLRPGRATITGDFDGVQDSVVVDVYTKEEAPVGYRRVHNGTNP